MRQEINLIHNNTLRVKCQNLVEKIIDDKIFTIEGNTGDQCAERTHTIGYYEILGFGVPQYQNYV